MTTPDLSLCGICGAQAEFTEADPGANPVSYCARHLPTHLQTRAAAGQLPLAPAATTVVALQAEARELDVEGRSSMDKEELLAAVNEAKAEQLPEPDQNPAAEFLAEELESTPPPAPKKKAARKK